MKKTNILLVFTHLVAVFMGIFVFYIVSNISENNTDAWYNGTIDLSTYNEIPEIRMMSRKFGDLDAIYLYSISTIHLPLYQVFFILQILIVFFKF